MTEILLWCWVGWVLLNVGMFILSALLVQPQHTPHYNGFTIFFPTSIFNLVTPDEAFALLEHEEGHQVHLHIWKNLIRICCFFPISKRGLRRQEEQADDFVTDTVALASALRKLAKHPQDLARAERLEQRLLKQGPQDAGNLTSGTDAQ